MKKGLKKTIVFLWRCWSALLTALFVLTIGLFWSFPLALSPKTFPLSYKGLRLWAWLVFYGSGFRLKVDRKVRLDKKQPYIFVANHTSTLDIMVMALLNPHHPLVFVGKAELARIPIFGMIYKKVCIVVDRSDLKSRTHVFTLAKERLSMGQSIVIFPEGGIPHDTSVTLGRFKDGPFSIAISTQTPIAVYAIRGLKEMYPEKMTQGYPGKVTASLAGIIDPTAMKLGNKKELKEHCYEMIEKALSAR